MKLSESEKLELKKSTSELKEGIISIASILNKHGSGELYFGINDKGVVFGQPAGSKTLREVSHIISENIEPKIYPKVEERKIEGKTCIYASFSGESAPYFAYGRAYMRVGDEDRQISARELEALFIKKNKEALRWDNKICKNASYADISSSKLRVFLKKANLAFDSPENSLKKLNLTQDGKLLNSAILFFGKRPQKFLANARLRCAVFAGSGTAEIIDRQEYEGEVFYLIESAQKYILKNIHMGMRVEGLERIDVPEIDMEAVREAVINAFCHRDYNLYDSVNIAIFADRVEIRSPGLLYGGLTIERILKERVSERRNELIAELLHRVHFIERWGRGVELILSKEPSASFKEVGRQFISVFPRTPKAAPQKRVTEKVTVKVPEKVTVNQSAILKAIATDSAITSKRLAGLVGISERKIKENIRKLKEKGLLKRVGADKGGYWEAKER
ncbi:ATP-dependent DNA helicase [Candidatus Micrarchaeota archaeon CG11_big_fil_rev_8_21_14_0_20_47_5]|nr:MAG: ATP-dependent DNA helicase [Candidatus Micrarchaeota archaeon CG1_02_47_40]PIN83329.1 MAG: ATP-dependent DNA helicase [Candidatus Micrarchaeota archaeon CG11_big_fil_rev_8_21_14_0_20_47_5]